MCTGIAQGFGASAELTYERVYPATVNTLPEAQFACDVAASLVGEDKVVRQTEPLTGSEDFAYMLEAVPGSYLFIGNGDAANGGHGACMVHNPNYDFEDRNIPIGAAFWVQLAKRYLV